MVDVKLVDADKIPNVAVAHDWVTFRKCLALGAVVTVGSYLLTYRAAATATHNTVIIIQEALLDGE
jgi:hypothetical protein